LFLGDENKFYFKGDYAQQEPRFLIHYAYLCNLPGAAEAVETFRKNPKTDYHAYTMEICNQNSNQVFTRKRIKPINLGLQYGMGLAKLCRQLGVTMEEGIDILKAYHKAIPFVKALSTKTMQVADDRGQVKTFLGRIRHFQLWEPVPERGEESRTLMGLSREKAEVKWKGRRLRRFGTHKALNAILQGSSADQTKKLIANLYYNFKKVLHLTVHDEIGASVEDMEEARVYKTEMEQAVTLQIPVVADCAIGRSWGEAKHEVA
jgi:DNA polymerase I-like protein with 3'-5' exonuclease and polymerase domains